MNILELDSYNLADAVKFNDQLNPRLWGADEHLRPEVRERLLEIAQDFREFLGVKDLDLQDITISGSNAAYTYTPNSDIDLHLVVRMPEDPVYRELFDAKKFQYNEQHNIKIGGYDVELYVQDADHPHISQGIYSVANNDWVQVPRRVKSVVDDTSTKNKFETVGHQIERAIASGSLKRITRMAEKIKKMRQTGLENHGEFGPENLAFKMLRSQGKIKELYDARNAAKDRELSLKEEPKKPFVYGFKEDAGMTWDGVDPTTCMFLNEQDPELSDEEILKDFIDFCAKELKIDQLPVIKLRKDPQWSVVNKTFGRYINDKHLLEVAWGQRHIMDILRTVAHELTHRHQHERDGDRMGPDAGETGSPYENEANARAGILMRDYARLHPDYFAVGQVEEPTDVDQQLDESLKTTAGATAVVACLLAGGGLSGCATQPQQTTQQVLRNAQDVGRVTMAAKNITRANTQAEARAEIDTVLRAGAGGYGSEGAANVSNILRIWRKLKGNPPVPAESEPPEYGPAEPRQRIRQYESASGYIPTKKQAKDPRYSMALTVDIKPGQVGKEANKLGLKTDRQGHPQVANPNGLVEALALQLQQFKEGRVPNRPLSQVPGEVEDDLGNQEATGPEFPPEWPEGTTKVDVSDLTDWYRLGQDISDMDDADPEDYNQGPPQTVIVFPSDEIEQGYLPQFKRLGLKTHDMDPDVKGGEDLTGKHQLKKKLAEQELDEVRMAPSNLQQWATSPEAQGIRAGFEAELIFRDTVNNGDDDYDMEPDYDMDERCGSIQQIIDFFGGGDYGMSSRALDRLQEQLDETYYEWYDEQMQKDFNNEAEDLIRKVLVDEDDWDLDNEIQKQLVMQDDVSDDELNAIIQAGEKAPKFTSSKEQILYAEANPLYEKYLDAQEEAEGLLDDLVADEVRKQGAIWDAALDDFRDNYSLDDDSGFFDDTGLRWMSDVSNNYDAEWPYMTGGGHNDGSRDWEEISDSLNKAVDMPVKASSGYHGTTRKEGLWIVEPDTSLQPDDSDDFGLEIVSPPMPLLVALNKLQEVCDWANSDEGNAYTNSSTGLHMGVSVPYKGGDVDYVKLILFLGDEYVLQQFGREANTYCASAMKKLRQNVGNSNARYAANVTNAMELMRGNLIELANREIQKGVGDSKYTSAHIQDGYIEFRSAGGDWLAEESADPEKLSSTMLRYARAMQIAADPSAERREYAKKLYKLIAPNGDDQLALFSQFTAGELDAEQLKKRWAEKAIGTEKKMNQRWKLYQNVDGRWEPVPGGEWNGYEEDQVKNAVWSKYGREALDSGEYQLVNMGEQSWEVYDVKTGKTLEIVKGKSKGEVADQVYDKYVDQGIGFQVRPYEDPATMTPRAKLAKRIVKPKEKADWDVIYKPTGRVIDNILHVDKESAQQLLKKVAVLHDFKNADDLEIRPQTAERPQSADDRQDSADLQATLQNTERGEWEFYRTETGNVIDRVNDASRMQANAVRQDIVRRYGHPDASVGMRRVDQSGVQDVEPNVAQNFAEPTTTYEIHRSGQPSPVRTFQAATHPEAMAELERFRQNHSEIPPHELALRNLPVNENFADGKGPGRPGDSVRHGIPKGATIAQLEKASHSAGRKGELARWQLNMRRGKKK
jgi:hypothetical protein